MKLPAPALACACPGCKRQLNKDFAAIVVKNFTTDELLDLLDLAKIGFGQQTFVERIDAYSVNEAAR